MKKIAKSIPGMFVFLFLVFPAAGQTFQDFLDRVASLPDASKPTVVDSFMNACPRFPYTENDTTVHYLYRGNASSITIAGDAGNWNPSVYSMTKIPGTDLWYRTVNFESDARLDYKFVLGGSNWILDPGNPYQVSGGYGPNSELRMPGYIPPSEIQYGAPVPHGTFKDTVFASVVLGNSRTVQVYTPPDYSASGDSFGVILFHDGLEYVTLAYANRVLDNLIAWGRISPVIAVFVPPVERTEEYAGSLKEEFTAFVVDEIMAWVDSRFRTLRDPASRAVLGASNGGNISLWQALHRPDIFGCTAAQSSNVESSISGAFESGEKLGLSIYLDIGTYDIPALIPMVRNLKTILENRGYPLEYHEYHEGHSWGNWRAHIDDALERFFPPSSSEVPESPGRMQHGMLRPNFPNPFNPSTTIAYSLARSSPVILTVFDTLGRAVGTLVSRIQDSGTHTVIWNGRDESGRKVPGGVYFCRLTVDGSDSVAKMVLLD